jgi:iron(II)-dependent oxidoreductase
MMNIPNNLSPQAKELAQNLLDARQRELEVLAGLNDEQMFGSRMRIIEPPIWEMGHVGWFQEHWILRNLDKTAPIKPAAYKLYDSFNIPNAERWELAFPSRQETLAYITAVLECCIQRLGVC